jgi:uncharacterized lipoprotein
MSRFCVTLLVLMSVLMMQSGCSTIADCLDAKGQGTSRIYNAPFETVWKTTPKALNDLGLSVAGQNREEGYILAGKGMTAFSYGENVGVFIDVVSDEQTKVETVSKKTMATNLFAWNWEKRILDKLSEMLSSE